MNSRSEVARPILTCVTNRQLARIHAALRVRLGVRQQDVAARAGIDRKRVGKLEAAQIDELTVGELRSCFEALGARVEVSAYFRGAALDRLLDEVHATTLGAVVAVLKAAGWEVRIEVTFSSMASAVR